MLDVLSTSKVKGVLENLQKGAGIISQLANNASMVLNGFASIDALFSENSKAEAFIQTTQLLDGRDKDVMMALAPIIEDNIQKSIDSVEISIELDYWGTPTSYSMPSDFEFSMDYFIDSIEDAYLED